jgi:hypothetical protein
MSLDSPRLHALNCLCESQGQERSRRALRLSTKKHSGSPERLTDSEPEQVRHLARHEPSLELSPNPRLKRIGSGPDLPGVASLDGWPGPSVYLYSTLSSGEKMSLRTPSFVRWVLSVPQPCVSIDSGVGYLCMSNKVQAVRSGDNLSCLSWACMCI